MSEKPIEARCLESSPLVVFLFCGCFWNLGWEPPGLLGLLGRARYQQALA